MAEKKSSNFGTGVAAGAGLIAAIATGYFLYGPKGSQNRKKIRAWTIKAKGEVLSEFEKMKDVSEASYLAAIDKVVTRYAKLKDIDAEEVQSFSDELKRHWKSILKEMTPKPAKKAVKKVAKK